jgi:hypothetical protein
MRQQAPVVAEVAQQKSMTRSSTGTEGQRGFHPLRWVLGEAAQAAPARLSSGQLPSTIANPSNIGPGILPATNPPNIPVPFPATPTVAQRRAVFGDCSTYTVDNDAWQWVPGVFRPNFNTTFAYTPYNGRSFPSALRFGDPTSTDPVVRNSNLQDPTAPTAYSAGQQVYDRDPLFGFAVTSPNFSNPLATNDVPTLRTNNDGSYNFETGLSPYGDYYINDNSPSLRNGLCFYVRVVSNQVRARIDQNGPTGSGVTEVAVEALLVNNNANPTISSGTNPVLAVILDERTRRPIPLTSYQPLVATDDNQRKRPADSSTPRQLIRAAETRVNSLVVSGQVPSRPSQTNGGLHNFLRLNEFWRDGSTDVPLNFSGSMIQLNYSTYATAPYAQDSFEPPNLTPLASFSIGSFDYYLPPQRRYGYDVGFLIARRPSAVAKRFELPTSLRTEFLRDLEPQDAYVRRLRCALEAQAGVDLADAAQTAQGCNDFN